MPVPECRLPVYGRLCLSPWVISRSANGGVGWNNDNPLLRLGMKWPFKKSDGRPEWQPRKAEKLLGTTVIVGLTYDEPGGTRQEQFYGTVMSADPNEGITLRLDGRRSGEFYTLPPDIRAFSPARPGEYRLRATGEVVVNPDYTTTWTSTPPRQ